MSPQAMPRTSTPLGPYPQSGVFGTVDEQKAGEILVPTTK